MASLTYLEPVISLILLGLAVGILTRRWRVVAAAALLLFFWSWQPVSAFLSYTLERRYPVRDYPAGEADAIVALTGGIHAHHPSMPEDLPREDMYLRASHASWLYRHWKPLPIVVSGGSSGRDKVIFAEVMRRVLVEQGVPASMIWVEGRSRSTYENALYSSELLRAKGIRRIALVTEAYHMQRSERAFEKQGMTVVPAPCAFRYVEFSGDAEQFVPSPRAIEHNEIALHEWLGLLWYHLRGRA